MADTDERLRNWGRYMRVHRIRRRCLSFEGNYRSPQRGHWEEAVAAVQNRVDAKDAVLVEIAWGTLPMVHRVILRGFYVIRGQPQAICRIAARLSGVRVRFSEFDARLEAATVSIGDALGRSEDENRNISRTEAKKTLDFAVSTS